MKVIHILNELNPSGAEVMLEVAYPFWNTCKIESYILSTGEIIGPYYKNLSDYSIFHLPFSKSLLFFKQFYKIIKSVNPDIIHIHTERAYPFYAIIGIICGAKIIRTVHHIFHFSGLLRIRKIIERKVCLMLGVKFVSNSNSGWLNEKKRFFTRNIFISNWIKIPDNNIKFNIREVHNINSNDIVLLTIGGNWGYKNIDKIIFAVKGINLENIKFFHIGLDENQKLKKIVDENKLNKTVFLLGFIEDINPYLKQCDIFLMPSDIEGFGVAAVEAISMNKKVILSYRPALFDLTFFDNNVSFVEPTIEGIKEGIVKTIDGFNKKISYKSNKELVNDLFNPTVGAFYYYNLYLQVLSK